ncbi:MAG: c-type cytochrome [Acidobacteria bacterium]|nr:c-type cytochrome [Acidobacteriota bacterium]
MRISLFLIVCATLSGRDAPRDLASIEAGGKLYATACSGCHGMTGEGGRGPNLSDNRMVRRRTDDELFRTVKTGVPGSDMPPFAVRDDQAWQVVGYVRNMSAPAIDSPLTGDPAAGGVLFEGKAGCSGCHAVNGRGGTLGPDLSNAGSSKTLKQLREAVLDPNARLTEGFQGIEARLKDGRVIQGVARNYSNYSIQVTGRSGEVHLIRASDAAQVTWLKKSYMPADAASRLSKQEIGDLLAYLSRQSLRTQ